MLRVAPSHRWTTRDRRSTVPEPSPLLPSFAAPLEPMGGYSHGPRYEEIDVGRRSSFSDHR